jgi:hypothetical protein
MLNIKYCLIFLTFMLFSSTSIAGDWVNEYWKSMKSRQQTAKILLEEYQKLNNQIPNLSPREQDWLKTEYDEEIAKAGGHYTKRSLDASNSREYQISVSKLRLLHIRNILNSLSRKYYKNQKEEVELWTKLASAFIDRELWQAIDKLVSLGIVDKNISEIKEPDFENHVLWANQILDEIVIKYFKGELVQ